MLIGINSYNDKESFEDLKYCGRDVEGLRDRLQKCGFPENHIYLLNDDAKNKRFLPFKSNIDLQLKHILGSLNKGDLIVVAFSGHGVYQGGKSYLCPTDGRLGDPQGTMVAVESVYQWLQDSKASLKLMMVDACRDVVALPSSRNKGARSAKAAKRAFVESFEKPPRGILLLTSCAPGEEPKEEETFHNGVFMHYVLEGLAGKADIDKNGRVSLAELWKYTNDQTNIFVWDKYAASQRPGLKGDLIDDFDLSVQVARIGTRPATRARQRRGG